MVASPSTVGQELAAQQIVAAELDRLGFGVTELPIPAETAAGPPGGVAQASYLGRPDVLGRINPDGSPALLLNGHVDVVLVPAVLHALAGLEDELNQPGDDPAFDRLARPYNVNVGTVTAGNWPSSVPAQARLGVRMGFPRRWAFDEAFDRLRSAVLGAAADDPWLASHPPSVHPVGLRAEGYLIDDDHPLVTALAAAHADVHGEPPWQMVLGSTTDARYYLNQFGVPAVAYGPRSRNIHGNDEAVELASIVSGARAMARFIAGFFAGGGR